MAPLHPCGYPPDLLNLMVRSRGEPPADAHSPSRLQGCPRQQVLMAQHDYYVDVDYQYPMTRGHMVHALMETADYPNALAVIRESRLHTFVGGSLFQGKPDLVVIKELVHDVRGGTPEHYVTAKVVDYKSKNDIAHDLTEAALDHQIQVNLYAWLVSQMVFAPKDGQLWDVGGADAHYPVVVDELEIVYCDMRKVRRFTTAGPLEARGKRLTRRAPYEYETLTLAPLKLKSKEWCERYIRRQISVREKAFEVLPPVLGPDDAWKCERCPVREICEGIG